MELRNWASISEGWVGREDGEELGSPSKFKFISKFKLTIRTREWHRGPYGILPMFATSAFISAFCQEEVYLLLQREREREKGFKRLLSCVSVDTSLPDSPGMWAPLLPYSHLAHIP